MRPSSDSTRVRRLGSDDVGRDAVRGPITRSVPGQVFFADELVGGDAGRRRGTLGGETCPGTCVQSFFGAAGPRCIPAAASGVIALVADRTRTRCVGMAVLDRQEGFDRHRAARAAPATAGAVGHRSAVEYAVDRLARVIGMRCELNSSAQSAVGAPGHE